MCALRPLPKRHPGAVAEWRRVLGPVPPAPRPSSAPARDDVSGNRAAYPNRHPGEGRDPVHLSAMVRLVAALLALIVVFSPARAVEPGEMLKDPALEARARHISQELQVPRLPEPVYLRQQLLALPLPALPLALSPLLHLHLLLLAYLLLFPLLPVLAATSTPCAHSLSLAAQRASGNRPGPRTRCGVEACPGSRASGASPQLGACTG